MPRCGLGWPAGAEATGLQDRRPSEPGRLTQSPFTGGAGAGTSLALPHPAGGLNCLGCSVQALLGSRSLEEQRHLYYGIRIVHLPPGFTWSLAPARGHGPDPGPHPPDPPHRGWLPGRDGGIVHPGAVPAGLHHGALPGQLFLAGEPSHRFAHVRPSSRSSGTRRRQFPDPPAAHSPGSASTMPPSPPLPQHNPAIESHSGAPGPPGLAGLARHGKLLEEWEEIFRNSRPGARIHSARRERPAPFCLPATDRLRFFPELTAPYERDRVGTYGSLHLAEIP